MRQKISKTKNKFYKWIEPLFKSNVIVPTVLIPLVLFIVTCINIQSEKKIIINDYNNDIEERIMELEKLQKEEHHPVIAKESILELENMLNNSETLSRTNTETLTLKARYLFSIGETDSYKIAKKILKREKYNIHASFICMKFYFNSRYYDEAIKIGERLLDYGIPFLYTYTLAEIYNLIAKSYHFLDKEKYPDKEKNSLNYFKKAYENDHSDERILDLGVSYFLNLKYKDALKYFRMFYNNNSDNEKIIEYLKISEIELGIIKSEEEFKLQEQYFIQKGIFNLNTFYKDDGLKSWQNKY